MENKKICLAAKYVSKYGFVECEWRHNKNVNFLISVETSEYNKSFVVTKTQDHRPETRELS